MKTSIKARITLWYAALIMFICAAALFSLFAASESAGRKHCEETLRSAAVIIMDEMEIEHGIMEIDSDIDEVPGVYAALFDMEGALIYGRRRVELPFEEGVMRSALAEGHSWMVLDTLLTVPNVEPVWLRIHMSADLSQGVYRSMARYGLWLLPLLAAVALAGGYLITARAFRPVGRMSQVAASIVDGGDLSGRVQTDGDPDGKDELHALGRTINGMLERLEAAFERERQFTSDVAHELRTPLNAMSTQGEYALSCEDAEQKDEAIARMLQKNGEMSALIGQLLMLSRLDAGRVEMEEGVALAPMLASIAEDLLPVAQEKDVVLETALEDVSLRGNRSMLARAVINIADNAIRYGKSCVKLSLVCEDGEAVIRVEDDGPGMTRETVSRIFDRFWRADESRTTAGTGIGLSIALAAVRAHGGRIDVQSELGHESVFSIHLPLSKG